MIGSAQIFLCLFAAALWGLWWIPIRWIVDAGFPDGAATLALMMGALPFLAGFAILKPEPTGRRAAMGAVLVGLAVALYGIAITQTDVVRVVLIFYLAPMWGLLIERFFLGRRLTIINALAIVLSLGGLVIIMRGNVSLSDWRAGDLMALLSGMFWAAGAALIFVDSEQGYSRLALISCIAAIVFAGAFSFGQLPDLSVDLEAIGIAFFAGIVFHAPILLITLWAALSLPPATISFLLTAEIVTGVASGALLLDEPFGAPEAIGAALVFGAAAIEVVSVKLRQNVEA